MNTESFKNEMIEDKNYTKAEEFIRFLRLSLFIPGFGQDVVIKTNNKKRLYGYSSIILARSQSFKEHISGNKLKLGYNYEVVKKAFEYIYTSICVLPVVDPNEKVKTSFDLTCDLLSFAKIWSLYEIRYKCEQYIASEFEKEEEVKSGKDESNQIKNHALKKLNYIDNLNLQNFSEKILCVVDKQMEDVIKSEDYLHISDSSLRMIVCRDTLNISREFQILEMIGNFANSKFDVPKENQNQNQNQIEEAKKRALKYIKQDLVKFIRFGAMTLDEFLQIEKLDLLTDDEINDISDFIENKLDGNDSKNQKIIEKYKKIKEVHWFRNKRFYFDSNTIISFENEEIFKNINPKNADKKEGLIKDYTKKLKEWIDEEIFQEMKLQFVSKKEDKLTCQDFHQICDNKAPILVIIQSGEDIFGGYSSVGWKKPEKQEPSDFYNDNYFDDINIDFDEINSIEDDKAFLFVLKSYTGNQEKIELKEKESNKAIVYYSQRGPIFGDGWDLAISGDLKTGYSNPGHTYQLPDNIEFDSKEAKMFFTTKYVEWKVDQLEVYF